MVGLVPRDGSTKELTNDGGYNVEDCGEQQLRAIKLTNQTAKEAVLKGVVTESHFIAANKRNRMCFFKCLNRKNVNQ